MSSSSPKRFLLRGGERGAHDDDAYIICCCQSIFEMEFPREGVILSLLMPPLKIFLSVGAEECWERRSMMKRIMPGSNGAEALKERRRGGEEMMLYTCARDEVRE